LPFVPETLSKPTVERQSLTQPIFEKLALWEDSVPRGAALQMALDQALLELTDVPVLRVYHWESPCVTLGYFESQAAAVVAHPGVPVVRRWTGGGMVLHGDDAPYSLIVPQTEPFAAVRPADAYRILHGALAESLQGRLPEIVLAAENAQKRGVACFENPVSDDLLCGGRKIGGAGQRRTRHGLLHQGSLQLKGAPFEEAQRFAQLLAVRVHTAETSPELLLRAERIAQTRYGVDEWNRDGRNAGS
jgi:lipoate-protein ligase A